MDPTKTRIWNADKLGIPALVEPPNEPARKPADTRPFAAARRVDQTPARSTPPPPPPRRARASVPPPTPGTLTAMWSAANAPAAGSLASTRIMPIESLLPGGLPSPLKPEAATTKPRHQTLKRIAGHLLLATLTLLAVAIWKLPLGELVRARPPQPTAAESPKLPAITPIVDVVVDGDDQRPPQPHVTSPPQKQKPKSPPPQRHAIELLISGDYLTAEQTYRQLATDHPNTPVFQEAARILAARHAK